LIVKTGTENIEAELVEANDDFVFCHGKRENLRKIGKGRRYKIKSLMEI
jgi:ribosome maturation factor RimP